MTATVTSIGVAASIQAASARQPMTKEQLAKAQEAATSRVESAAFNAGESRARLIAETQNALGNKPKLALYDAVGLALTVGYMASALARKGDNRTEQVLRKHCRDRILNYQGAGGTGKLRTGQKGRRTQPEEDAYTSARVLKARIMADAGVAKPQGKSGGSNKGSGKSNKPSAKTGKSGTAKGGNDNSKPVIRKLASADAVVEHVDQQRAALLAFVNKNATLAPSWLKSVIGDFSAAFTKAAAAGQAE